MIIGPLLTSQSFLSIMVDVFLVQLSAVSHGISDGRHLASSSAVHHDVRPVVSTHEPGEFHSHDWENPPLAAQRHCLVEDRHVTRVQLKPHISQRSLTSHTSTGTY